MGDLLRKQPRRLADPSPAIGGRSPAMLLPRPLGYLRDCHAEGVRNVGYIAPPATHASLHRLGLDPLET